ncbi:Mth938-like domain-containing protein [Aspergillus ruber CBS 135680]|uniref:NADH dehydrogenase [ubiquinone] 1 alpha subcomplex assembly factor 3 n=1 Tax=Aspergillus ruber (strain CBS 135680) TaxID=1388766 RepID=A0A017SP93_ASPRC|nr:uncharacterized protein EURHEDRAFT_409355 [Aspergillus ruber CBS 135680]EYE98045.1 hypothetical protein EURHEDRAFT_409355 [Aspergillus ruber CBS 135680]
MHSPSPQLLRTLRAFITPITSTTTTALRSSRIAPQCTATSTIFNSSSHRYNSTQPPRPTRMIPRSHASKPTSHDRGPAVQENTNTDLNALNVLGNIPAPTTAVEATLDDGFHLDNGLKVRNGDGVMLVGGEAFAWRPWATRGSKAEMVNKKGQFEVDEEVWGVLGLVWPRPDLLIIGMGENMFPLSPETKKHISLLGIRVEILSTRNAASQFNMLATERGVTEIAAAMIPSGWKGR